MLFFGSFSQASQRWKARVTARIWEEHQGTQVMVRGACWSTRTLTRHEKDVMRAVANATSRQQVVEIAQQPGNEDLLAHIQGERYVRLRENTNVAPMCIKPKSRSGRNTKPGRSNWVPWKAKHGAVPYSRHWPSNWEWFAKK